MITELPPDELEMGGPARQSWCKYRAGPALLTV